MQTNYVVCHARKIATGAGLSAVVIHNTRTGVYDQYGRLLGERPPDYISHPERARQNALDQVEPEVVHKRRRDRIEDADLLRKPQKNAAAAIEFIVSASPEWFDNHDQREWRDYFYRAQNFLERTYGRKNTLHAAVHYDEKTPHLHLLMVPIQTTEKGNRYSSSEFLGGRQGLARLQTKIAEDLGEKFGLERGQDGSTARHKDQYHFAAHLTEARRELNSREARVDRSAAENERQRTTLAQREQEIQRREKALVERENAVESQEAAVAGRELTLAAREKVVAEKDDGYNTVLKEWDLPAADFLESGTKYRARIHAWVIGAVKRILDRTDETDEIKKEAAESVAYYSQRFAGASKDLKKEMDKLQQSYARNKELADVIVSGDPRRLQEARQAILEKRQERSQGYGRV